MKPTLQFFQTPTGQLLIVGLLATVAAGFVAWQRSQRPALPRETQQSAPSVPLPKVFHRPGARFEPPVRPTPAKAEVPGSIAPTPTVAKVLPLGIVVPPMLPTDLPEAGLIVPYGRMIPCETVVTLESNRLTTPVVGLVTEDVWERGVRVIPAGAEVHGRAALDRNRERIAVEGSWTVVWRESDPFTTHELRLSGIALEREPSDATYSKAYDTGSAGLRGAVVRTDDRRELKLFAATFLSSATTALQESRPTTGLFGESSVPLASARNASLAGTAAVLRAYAEQLRDAIAADGFYLRVPAGKPFYLYVTQSFSPESTPVVAQPHSQPIAQP